MIDFKEIPSGNTTGEDQDKFELFAQSFLSIHYEIVVPPSRGADGGQDLIVAEKLEDGSKLKWLVSCKHKAHSARSVSEVDEQNIMDRVEQHGCDGFMTFYSTLSTAGLGNRLKAFIERGRNIKIYNHTAISDTLLSNPQYDSVFASYFPDSYSSWKDSNGYHEPEGLYEWFLEKFYQKIYSLLKDIFLDPITVVKKIRANDSFRDMLLSADIEIIHEDIMDNWDKIKPSDYSYVQDNNIESLDMLELFGKAIPYEMTFWKDKDSIQPTKSSSVMYVIYKEDHTLELVEEFEGCRSGAYTLTPNYLVVSDRLECFFDDSFSRLKPLLGYHLSN